MINSNVATVELAGAIEAVEFSTSYSYYWLDNQSSEPVYASLGELSAEADGTYTIPAGGKLRIAGGMFPGKINLLGNGKVQIIATNTAVSPFRGGGGSSGGGEIPTFCFDGIVGFFDTASADISNGIWRNGIDGYNDITLNGGAIEGNALKAVGGDIGDFAVSDLPKVIYIVVKKDEQEVDSCIIGVGRSADNNSYGFGSWLTGENYIFSQGGAPYINAYNAELGKYHCIAIVCQSNIDTKNSNGAMFFVDGNLAGFLSGHLYGYYSGFVSILQEYCKSYMYQCEKDTFIRSIAIGTQEHSVQQIIQNSKYLMRKYM